ncbi:putative heterokaryon incompatibility [Diplodia seriata]|uniref:Putative heterokaryon incompatibility n=1 Tax=Diplodia seriata TaxID=420778 RepID=A0A0G2EIB5_9PEZI|nr:putative heterokaryon incompatibility [Diplodia seriata]
METKTTKTGRVAATIPTGCDAGFWEAFAPQLESSGHGANIDTLQSFATYRNLVSTEESFAITPTEVGVGDVVCLIQGASVPFVLSPVDETQSTYKLAGECYLHGTKGPKHVDDYMELLGVYRTNFDCTDQRDLPWKEAYLV